MSDVRHWSWNGPTRSAATITVLVGIGLIMSAAPPAQAHSLEFSDEGALGVSLGEAKKSGEGSVVVKNDGPAVPRVTFAVVAGAKEPPIRVTSSRTSIRSRAVERFDLTFAANAGKAQSGDLIVRGAGDVIADARPVDLTVPPEVERATAVVLVSLVAVGAFLVVLLLKFRTRLGYRLGPANWSFTDSWASNLTLVGAILGAVLAGGVLSDQTRHLTKETYAGLNVMFGVIAVVAGFIYLAYRTSKSVKTDSGIEAQYQGFVWTFCVAGMVTLWAVLGQVGTLYLLVDELWAQGSIGRLPMLAFTVLLGVTVVAALAYSWTTITATVRWQAEPVSTAPAPAADLGPGERASRPEPGGLLAPVSVL
jgi:hypothetical protein